LKEWGAGSRPPPVAFSDAEMHPEVDPEAPPGFLYAENDTDG
jgi:hypothetical protein